MARDDGHRIEQGLPVSIFCFTEGLREGEQVVLKPVLAEVEQDTNEETPLVFQSDLCRRACRCDRVGAGTGTGKAGHRVALIGSIARVGSRQPLALRILE
jgi:hypothetical protein